MKKNMSTTGRRFARRTNDKLMQRVLDTRAKAILNAVLTERPGRSLDAYLRGFDRASTRLVRE